MKTITFGSVSCAECRRVFSNSRYITNHKIACASPNELARKAATRRSWHDMRQRCFNPRDRHYSSYGARGITVCEEWRLSFDRFLDDVGLKPEGKTLDRINNDGNYQPGNCRWSTPLEQSQNTRRCVYLEHMGERLTLGAWARKLGYSRQTIPGRLKRGWSIQSALTPREALK